MTFEELAAQRHLLQDFCRKHTDSVSSFRMPSGGYKVTYQERASKHLHLTTTATCIESLLGCPQTYRRAIDVQPEKQARQFALDCIQLPPEEWRSEDSASIYCRCRTLPLVLRHLDPDDPDNKEPIAEHLWEVFGQLHFDHERFAIGEAAVPADEATIEETKKTWYPANAFHTYWALDILDTCRATHPAAYHLFEKHFQKKTRLRLERVRMGMLLWARRTVGCQVALHAADSSTLDSDQLAWALAILLKFESHGFPGNLEDQDLLRESLVQLFRTQLQIGTWRHYRSLFHYKKVGNAYCYVYETFSILLGISLEAPPARKFFRDSLRSHIEGLTALWRYADATQQELRSTGTPVIGWSSGHRLHKNEIESWATASVFAFAQGFRRLLGLWTRDAAKSELNFVNTRLDNPIDVLRSRGQTWAPYGATNVQAADQLLTMFIHPLNLIEEADSIEPDTEPIGDDQARSAILFGPPGTSKTTLCRAVASAVGWDYIELHASHFVSDGMQNVQRSADSIFSKLMELDHTVVLFDEIDELVRGREEESESFGRFLTTSMLPKLAELWKQKKILYFVATNYLNSFDAAIMRSQRFDATIFVAPPSYKAKINRLSYLLRQHNCQATFENLEEEISKAVDTTGKQTQGDFNDNDQLAKFVLLRWDQLDELALRLSTGESTHHFTAKELKEALKKISDQKLTTRKPYNSLLDDLKRPRRDFDKRLVWRVEGIDAEVPGHVVESDGQLWLTVQRGVSPPQSIGAYKLSSCTGDRAIYRRDASNAKVARSPRKKK